MIMSENCMRTEKKICGYNNDAISQLPDPIIGHILGFLPLVYSVRTSVLSREWRFKYLELLTIAVFATQKLLPPILGMLRAHDGPIRNMCVVVPDELESFTEIDQILNLVSKKGVRKFIFLITEARPRILDSSLYSCSQLTYLLLHRCILFQPPPEFAGFPKLVTLSFYKVTITAQQLSTLISQSPLLQLVRLLSTAPFNDRVEFTAPNLNFFNCKAHFKTLISLSAPRLNVVAVNLPISRTFREHKDDLTLLEIKPVDSIVSLHLDYFYMKALRRSGSRSKFENLRLLRLSEICFGIRHEVKCLLELMKSCGTLEKLIIEAFHVSTSEQDDDVTFHEGLDLSCSRIREVQMLDMVGSKAELAFIQMLMLKLLQLETMAIAPDVKNVFDGGDNILELVSKFRRTSPLATIDIIDSDACKKSLDQQISGSLLRWNEMQG